MLSPETLDLLRQWWKVRPTWLQHDLGGGLNHPIPGSSDAERTFAYPAWGGPII